MLNPTDPKPTSKAASVLYQAHKEHIVRRSNMMHAEEAQQDLIPLWHALERQLCADRLAERIDDNQYRQLLATQAYLAKLCKQTVMSEALDRKDVVPPAAYHQ